MRAQHRASSSGAPIDLGGEILGPVGEADGFSAKLGASGGHVWSQRLGNERLQASPNVAFDGAGDVVLFGSFVGGINLGGPGLTAPSHDLFVAKLDTAGDHVWSRSFGDDESQNAHAFAVDVEGSILITGAFEGTLDLGGPRPDQRRRQRLEDGATVHAGPGNIVVARCGGVHVASYGSSEGAFPTTLGP
jgi:hypothetical protein